MGVLSFAAFTTRGTGSDAGAPDWQLGNRMMMRVPSRGSSFPILGASGLPARKSGGASTRDSRTGAGTPTDPIGNSSAESNGDSVAASSLRRGRGALQIPDPWKSPAAFASRFSAVEGFASSEKTPTQEHSMPSTDGRSPSSETGSSFREADSEQQLSPAASLPNGAADVSTVDDVASVLVGFASVKGGTAEGTPSQSSLDLGELDGVGEQLVDVLQRFAASDLPAVHENSPRILLLSAEAVVVLNRVRRCMLFKSTSYRRQWRLSILYVLRSIHLVMTVAVLMLMHSMSSLTASNLGCH